ncbi:MAG: acetyl-CoA carboxylase biotin carboxyl carrier protein subunit [Bacteroidales bacterium]|nr:acetyl-CoA carboxylase biotin carboxyl carrier protein subunit [Bacteroidales bacterium]MDD3858671.1 acetyl-CoA carboxylase biotin carboxyl carrier protein subunit [Bacteroidales bacterium]
MNENNIKFVIDDVEYETNSIKSFDKRKKWTQPDDRRIKSIIPGTIVEVFVNNGDEVNEGDAMLVIEAMKMNNQIKFERNGIVDKILVKPGDIVSRGHEMIILK